tara:strand:- start:409 stop:852 length:444 start_codon:yes stop_codon:yes gene_type:complete
MVASTAPAAPPQNPFDLPTAAVADAAAGAVPQSAAPPQLAKAPSGAFTKKWTARLFGKAELEAPPTEAEAEAAAEAAAAAAESSAARHLEVTFTSPGGGEEGGEEGLLGGVPRLFLGLHLSGTDAILAMEPGGLAAQVTHRAAASDA